MQDLLDNPAWAALTTVQSDFAQGTALAKRYRPGILPFAALAPEGTAADADPLMAAGESFYLIGRLPTLPAHWILESELPCAQMFAPANTGALPPMHETIVPLEEADKAEMFGLINRVQPGYYLPDTRQLGEYLGIRHEGRLVAMAGERMRLTGFSELSAICTLPEYTGLGYAQRLTTELIRRQTAAGVVSFLHVARSNQRALRLYEHLGFRHRRDISFFRVRKG